VRGAVATVRELKRREGRDIWVWGSLSLMRSLFAADVVDEVQLRVCPTTRGSGTRVFEDRRDLRALEARTFDNGVVLLRYEARR
jgi:dihydrofolate reductase